MYVLNRVSDAWGGEILYLRYILIVTVYFTSTRLVSTYISCKHTQW